MAHARSANCCFFHCCEWGVHVTYLAVPKAFCGEAYSFGNLLGSLLILPYMAGRNLLFQVVLHPMTCLTEFVVSVKPDDYDVNGYHQVNKFTDVWSVKHFIA